MRAQRVFTLTQVPDTIPQDVRQVLQGFAQSIQQLVIGANLITFATAASEIGSGKKAGRFNAQFLIGTITLANTDQVVQHNLGRQPVGAIEMLTVPVGPVAQPAASLALKAANAVSVTLRASAANRQFTLILL